MSHPTRPDVPPPLVEPVLDQIGTEIATEAVPADAVFTLRELQDRFGVSRTVAREAMRSLELLGMVVASRRVGLRVTPPSQWQLFHPQVIAWRLRSEQTRKSQLSALNQLRLGVEPIAARLAASHASSADCGELTDLARRLIHLEREPSRRVGEELETDLRFHAKILASCGNEMFAALAPSLLAMLPGRSVFGSKKRDPISGTASLHLDLAYAITMHRGEDAERIAREILEENRGDIL